MERAIHYVKKFFTTNWGNKALYLTITVALFGAIFPLQNKVKNLESKMALNQLFNEPEYKSSPLPAPHVDDFKIFKEFYCGIFQNQIFTLHFIPSGKVYIWAQHKSNRPFKFPPKEKPQFINNYHFYNEHLYWTTNLFGEKISFTSPLILSLNKGAKLEFLKSDQAIFSPLSCSLIVDL